MRKDVDVMVETCASSFSDCSDFLGKLGSEFISKNCQGGREVLEV